MDLDPELAALRPLGGFFLLRTGGGAPRGDLPTLAHAYERPATDGRGDDPLTLRVRKVADGIRAPEARVAASVAQQALAARLWSVALGSAAVYGRVPDLGPRLLRWDPRAGAPDDLWLTEVRPRPADAATLAEAVLHGHLAPLAAALRARHRIAPGLLWGNAASALVGTVRQLGRWAHAHGRPETARRSWDLAARLLAHPLLAGTGTLTPLTGAGANTDTGTGTDAGTAPRPGKGPRTAASAVFRRRSCCLYYRVPGGGVCGDCCFTRAPRSSPRAASG
ncbi:(2Fe-2S)-binding protein [Streptomyces sp. NPDC096152]|uniref:(2Fe-2S)-binding protein n=1 Tax=Streptomyces sp. NPDC096152 TaxID=3366078 RepID=UPI00381A6CD2